MAVYLCYCDCGASLKTRLKRRAAKWLDTHAELHSDTAFKARGRRRGRALWKLIQYINSR